MYKTLQTQVVIIGGGYSGIAAAKKLREAGIDFLVLEARHRIGGRVLSQSIPGDMHIELGAQWIGPDHLEISKWIAEAKYHIYPTNDAGKHLYLHEKKQSSYESKDGGPDMTPMKSFTMLLTIKAIDFFAYLTCEALPANNVFTRYLDKYSLEDLFGKMKFLGARELYYTRQGFEISSAQKSENMSLLHALYNVRSADGFKKIILVRNGAQESMIKEGAMNLLENIAHPFRQQIMLQQPVVKVTSSEQGVAVYTNDLMVTAKKVIMAIPPKLCSKIDFDTSQDNEKMHHKLQMCLDLRLGTPIKCFAIYDRPFWRPKYSGQILSDQYPFKASYDCSPENGKGILLFFGKEQHPGDFFKHPEETRKQMLTDEIVNYFGQEGREMIGYYDHFWNDEEEEWSGGGYAASFPPGAWTKYRDVMREPIENIHWAGTETAVKWYGYMEGAIDAGIRAAEEVREVLLPKLSNN